MADLEAVFGQLKPLLEKHAAALIVEQDTTEGYSLNTPYVEQWKKPLFFGGVQRKKNYVSFYLMPVYMFPTLLDSISEPLRKRMQGKSCFNFKTNDPALFAELDQLTEISRAKIREEYGF